MAKALHRNKRQMPRQGVTRAGAGQLDWRRRISDHVAFALLAYTGMQIFVTMAALKSGHASLLPYFALVVLVLATIPGCRLFEARWNELDEEAAHDPQLAGRFTRDVVVLWALALGLPMALTGAYLGIVSLFS